MKLHRSLPWRKHLEFANRHRTGLAIAAMMLLASVPTYAQAASPWERLRSIRRESGLCEICTGADRSAGKPRRGSANPVESGGGHRQNHGHRRCAPIEHRQLETTPVLKAGAETRASRSLTCEITGIPKCPIGDSGL